MSIKLPDIDIDVKDRDGILRYLKHIPASMTNDERFVNHIVGVYFCDIPQDYISGLASIDYKIAEEFGYIKFDLLHNTVYDTIKTRKEMDDYLNQPVDWKLLKNRSVVEKLFQIGNYYDLLVKHPVNDVYELAMFIALIRPGKKHLQGLSSWGEIEKEIWKKDNSKYQFKKSHALAYSYNVILQLNMLKYSSTNK